MANTVAPRSFFRHALVAVPRRVDGKSINRVSFSPATTSVFMIPSMRWRLALISFVVVAGSVGAGVAASTHTGDARPEQACVLPGPVPCSDDFPCTPYAAVCDTQQGQCVCVGGGDLGTDLGARDLGGDLGPTPGDAGATAGTPPAGGGMTSPPKSSGCSYVPGAI
jgi:hypothetical protein